MPGNNSNMSAVVTFILKNLYLYQLLNILYNVKFMRLLTIGIKYKEKINFNRHV